MKRRAFVDLLSSIGCASLLLGGGCAKARPAPAWRVFVSNEDSSDVSVIDPLAGETVATLDVGKRPRGIRAAPDGRAVYVALTGSPKTPPGAAARRCHLRIDRATGSRSSTRRRSASGACCRAGPIRRRST